MGTSGRERVRSLAPDKPDSLSPIQTATLERSDS
jgi:hypothetical protein